MRRTGFSVNGALSAWVCFLILAPLMSAAAAPRAVVPQKVHEFGAVSQGTKVEHDFVLRNEGDADLVIHNVVASCGCTASAPSSDKIAPGGEGTIKVSFDTSGFSGEKLKTVRVHTNDIDESSLVLTLRGTVEPDIIVEPRRVFFGDLIKGAQEEARTQRISVKVQEGSKSAITAVRSMSKYLAVNEVKSTAKERVIEVRVAPDTPLGELRERVIIGVSGTRESSINIPVYAAVKGPLRLKPSTLSFGVLEGSEALTRSIKLENLGKRPVQVTSVRSSDKAVTASVKEIQAGSLYVIDVKVNPALVQRELKAVIDVVTDSEEERQLSLTVYGILPPKA